MDTGAVADDLSGLGELASPFRLRAEQPVHAGDRDAQVEAMA